MNRENNNNNYSDENAENTGVDNAHQQVSEPTKQEDLIEFNQIEKENMNIENNYNSTSRDLNQLVDNVDVIIKTDTSVEKPTITKDYSELRRLA